MVATPRRFKLPSQRAFTYSGRPLTPRTEGFALSRTIPNLVARKTFSRMRSEEHTSELQSRLHLVCRLLLEKKKSPLSFISPSSISPYASAKIFDIHVHII